MASSIDVNTNVEITLLDGTHMLGDVIHYDKAYGFIFLSFLNLSYFLFNDITFRKFK